jgi:hypothetical protein
MFGKLFGRQNKSFEHDLEENEGMLVNINKLNMFKKILKLFIPKNSDNMLNYSVQNLPFLLTYEYYNLSRGLKHDGFYIDPSGNILNYVMPNKWNFYTSSCSNNLNNFRPHEIDERISPEELFQNLHNLIKKNSIFSIINFDLAEILQDILEAGYENTDGGCDMGIHSYSILVYDSTCDKYKNIILKTTGDLCITNKSIYTEKLLGYFYSACSDHALVTKHYYSQSDW